MHHKSTKDWRLCLITKINVYFKFPQLCMYQAMYIVSIHNIIMKNISISVFLDSVW